MKLRNKKTGEIGHFTSTNWNEIALIIMDDNGVQLAKYSSLAGLNKEWEDAPEEPKEYWYIDINGEIMFDNVEDDTVKVMREIGNYFDTREEAEQAVEKLKAWKRMKDYNVKFNLDFVRNKIDFTYSINNLLLDALDGEEQIFRNMRIVFGGEE